MNKPPFHQAQSNTILWVSRHSFCREKRRAIERVFEELDPKRKKEKKPIPIPIDILQIPDRFYSSIDAYQTIIEECLENNIKVVCVVLPPEMLSYLLYQCRHNHDIMILQWHGKRVYREKKIKGWKKRCSEGHWKKLTMTINSQPIGLNGENN